MVLDQVHGLNSSLCIKELVRDEMCNGCCDGVCYTVVCVALLFNPMILVAIDVRVPL